VGLRRRIHGGGDWGRRRRGGGLNWTGGTGCCFMEASLVGERKAEVRLGSQPPGPADLFLWGLFWGRKSISKTLIKGESTFTTPRFLLRLVQETVKRNVHAGYCSFLCKSTLADWLLNTVFTIQI
jgi:hypothetical protein